MKKNDKKFDYLCHIIRSHTTYFAIQTRKAVIIFYNIDSTNTTKRKSKILQKCIFDWQKHLQFYALEK